MAKAKCSYCGKDFEIDEKDNIVCPHCQHPITSLKKIPFKERVQAIKQTSLIKVELWSTIGSILGTIAVCIILIFFVKTLWFLVLGFGFSIIMLIAQAIGKYQQLKVMETVESFKSSINVNELLELKEATNKKKQENV